MGLFKKIKKVVRKVENFGRRVVGQGNIGDKEPELDETGLRSQAAKRLTVKEGQAGAGKISYNTEETV